MFNTPPLKAPFFEGEVELPQKNPNLPANMLALIFRRTGREWSTWCTGIARAVGFPIQSLSVTASLNFASMIAGASDDQTVTLAGVRANDTQAVVNVGLPTGLTAGLIFQGFVSDDDEVTVRCTNASTGTINPDAATFRIEVRRYS